MKITTILTAMILAATCVSAGAADTMTRNMTRLERMGRVRCMGLSPVMGRGEFVGARHRGEVPAAG